MKNLFKKSLLVLIGVLITSFTTNVWADEAGVFYSYFKYEIDGVEHTISREYANTDDATTDVGTVTSALKFKAIYIKVWNNSGGNICGGHMGYTLDNWTTTQYYATDTWSGWNVDGVSNRREISKEMETSIASSTDPSGKYSIPYYWKVWGAKGGSHCNDNWINNNNGYNFHIEYTILPPNATAITATPSGHISGSGTSDDPYIIPVGGDFSITLSGSEKGRDDDNSDVQYSVDGGSTWGTESSYTSKTFSNVTATDVQNYVFKARCYNSTDDLESPTITTKTVYYKTAPWSIAGSMNNWSTTANPIAHYSSGTGYAEMTLNANTAYTFKVKNRTNSDWWGYNTALTYDDSGDAKTFSSSGDDCSMTTAGAGTYTFTWNSTDHQLTVTYPTSYTVTFGYGDHGTSVTASGSTSGSITSGQYVARGEDVEFTEEHDDGYSLKGWFTASSGGSAVSGMSSSDNVLDNIGGNANVYSQYTENTYTVTFANDGHGSTSPTGSQEAGVVTGIEIGATADEGYEFDEWTSSNGGAFEEDEETASNTFIPTANTTLTAHFKQATYTSTNNIDKNGGDTHGQYTATYDNTSIVINTAPTRAGYHVDGYYREYDAINKDFTDRVAEPDGTLNGSKGYTDSNKKWKNEGAPTLYTKWAGNSHILKLYNNDGTDSYASTSVTVGSNSYTISAPTRAGYDFTGFYTAASGGDLVIYTNLSKPVSVYFDASANWIKDADVNLYAQWEAVELTFDNNSGSGDGSWSTASNWSPACVPTSEHDVTIAAAATVSGSAVAKSVTINQSTGSLTIGTGGTLDVIGTISNAAENRLEVMAGGSLIFDYSSAPSATVHLSVSGSDFRYIALPISGVSVSRAFAGQGVYTYVWKEGDGWERRGYYDDIMGNEPIAIYGQYSWTFSGVLSNASFGSVAYTSEKTYAGMNMYANSWTAPIRISGVTISGNADQVVYIDNVGSWSAVTAGDPGSSVIPAMSAFVILANKVGGGSVSIPYNTAVRNVAIPSSAPRRIASNDDLRDHITMNVTGNELESNLRLYENEQFTNEFDNGWEARFLEGDGRTGQLYVETDDKMTVLATPDLEGTVVGFIPGEATNYTISFEGNGRGYYLNDMLTQQSTLIEEGNTYMFIPDESTNATRFVISRTPMASSTITGVNNLNDGVNARKQMINGILYIIRDGRLYDATGALVK